MISYRKLAMRVLGHPLRVPTNAPRPASHRVTALALTAAMVAGMAAPAYADVPSVIRIAAAMEPSFLLISNPFRCR